MFEESYLEFPFLRLYPKTRETLQRKKGSKGGDIEGSSHINVSGIMFTITKIIDLSEITFFKNYFRLTETLFIFLNFLTWIHFIRFTWFTRPSCLPPGGVGDGLPVHQAELRYCSGRPSAVRAHRSPRLLPSLLHDSASCLGWPGHRRALLVWPEREKVWNIFTGDLMFFISTHHSVMASEKYKFRLNETFRD